MARNYAALPYEYLEEMEGLSDTEWGRLTRALLKYSMTGEWTELSGNERLFAKRVMNQEDRFKSSYAEISERRSEAGKKGAQSRWNNHSEMANDSKPWQTHSKNGNTETKTNTNTKDKKDTPISPRKKTVADETDTKAIEVLEYLNEKTGSRYRNSNNSLKHIRARLNENFTVEDCKAVIDKKCQEWKGDPKMEQYLRPETLFGSKFENYLNAPVSSRSFGKRKDVLPDWYNPDPNRDNGKKEEAPELSDKEKREFKELLKLGKERRTQV